MNRRKQTFVMKRHLEKRACCEYFVILDDVGLRIMPAQLKTHPRRANPLAWCLPTVGIVGDCVEQAI